MSPRARSRLSLPRSPPRPWRSRRPRPLPSLATSRRPTRPRMRLRRLPPLRPRTLPRAMRPPKKMRPGSPPATGLRRCQPRAVVVPQAIHTLCCLERVAIKCTRTISGIISGRPSSSCRKVVGFLRGMQMWILKMVGPLAYIQKSHGSFLMREARPILAHCTG